MLRHSRNAAGAAESRGKQSVAPWISSRTFPLQLPCLKLLKPFQMEGKEVVEMGKDMKFPEEQVPGIRDVMKCLPRETKLLNFLHALKIVPKKKVPWCTRLLQPRDGCRGGRGPKQLWFLRKGPWCLMPLPSFPISQLWPWQLSEDWATYEKGITWLELELEPATKSEQLRNSNSSQNMLLS